MLPELLASGLLAVAASSGGTGGISGVVTVSKAGAAMPDASNVVVWIDGLTLQGAPAGVVKAEMKSEHKSFLPRTIAVPKNAAVDFPNMDPIYHNVFSVSPGNRFDLGLYRSGTSKPNVFHEPGLVRVYCNIHPQMIGFVMVVDSSFVAVTGKDGVFRFHGVPPGSYKLKAWHEEGGETELPAVVRAGADAALTITLDASQYRPQAHKNKYGKDYPPPPPDNERY